KSNFNSHQKITIHPISTSSVRSAIVSCIEFYFWASKLMMHRVRNGKREGSGGLQPERLCCCYGLLRELVPSTSLEVKLTDMGELERSLASHSSISTRRPIRRPHLLPFRAFSFSPIRPPPPSSRSGRLPSVPQSSQDSQPSVSFVFCSVDFPTGIMRECLLPQYKDTRKASNAGRAPVDNRFSAGACPEKDVHVGASCR
ncbi:hypothetical protein QBC43DRAFT_356823, partial [Cladorrhinum sp. PSN259]